VNPRLIARLRAAEDGYPWRLIAEDAFVSRGWLSSEAIVILSRYPIVEDRRLEPWARGWQVALARLELPDGVRAWVVAVHVPSPVRPRDQRRRDVMLQRLADTVAGLDDPVIVLGDLNATPFAPAFRAFAATAGLSSARTFPATFPARTGPFGIAIDHVMVRGADLIRLQALPPRGSDHRAVAATVAIPSCAGPPRATMDPATRPDDDAHG
jgi:endonuclease/exonuclease/phosphatase (EEP) superfamily protein YafD